MAPIAGRMVGSHARSAYLNCVGAFAVSAVGRDRPGIVAAITAGLLRVDGNVEDSRMANLGGHFTVMLVVSVPEGQERQQVEAALAYSCEGLGLDALSVNELAPAGIDSSAAADHTITVYGSDHPGIVHSITTELAAAEINITDLQTRLTGSPASPLYVMMLEVELGDKSAAMVKERLRGAAERAAVEVSVTPLEAEAL